MIRSFYGNVQFIEKASAGASWRIAAFDHEQEQNLTTTIGREGQSTAGPSLLKLFQAMEDRYGNVYPISFTFNDEANNFHFRTLQGKLTYAELTTEGQKNLLRPVENGQSPQGVKMQKHLNATEKKRLSEETESVTEEEDELTTQSFTTESFTVMDDDFIGPQPAEGPLVPEYLVIAELDEVIDGDTFIVKILQAGSKIPHGVGETIRIRPLGIDTFETHSDYTDDHKDTDYENTKFANEFNISLDAVYRVAYEATDFAKEVLGAGYILAIDMEAKSEDGPVSKDMYNRYLGVAYRTDKKNPDKVRHGDLDSYLNFNKLMLKEKSKRYPHVPLAVPYDYFSQIAEYTRFDALLWPYQLGIRERGEHDRVGDIIDELTDENEIPPASEDEENVEVRYADDMHKDNRQDFFDPIDDRIEDLMKDPMFEYKVRIGDVLLNIPPLAIQVTRSSQLDKVKTLRSRSSIITKVGSHASTITLQLYFEGIDDINGHRIKMHEDSPREYYIDGLRPLIAQFKKAPFVPIDNEFINETLNIHAVALADLSVQTVPGFPQSLSATLTLAKFETESYLPEDPFLADMINYPLLRWYYQEALRTDVSEKDRSPYRTYLKRIPSTGLRNNITFSLADEFSLMDRDEAIRTLRNMDSPDEYLERLKNTETEVGRLIHDGMSAQMILDQYESYLSAKQAGLIPEQVGTYEFIKAYEENDLMKVPNYETLVSMNNNMGIDDNISFDPYAALRDRLIRPVMEFGGTPEEDKAYEHQIEAWEIIYGNVPEDDDANQSYQNFQNGFYPYESVGAHNFEVVPPQFTSGENQVGDIQRSVDIFSESAYSYGFARISLQSSLASSLFDPAMEAMYKRGAYKDDARQYDLPMTEEWRKALARIVQKGLAAEIEAKRYIDEYEKLKEKSEMTEGEIPMVDFDTSGILLKDINVMYENQFSSAQTRMLDAPTLQYLGSQDPYVQLSFESNQSGVERIRELLEETERYSREYRLGITSGFLGMDNHLTNLFGVRYIIPENVTVSTVPGFPDRFHIEMLLCGFDKTQKRSESLEGLSPIYGDKASKESRHVKKNPQQQDARVLDMRMNEMEVYPDLELPTYEELNKALPYLRAGLVRYPNPTNGRFVDPDFYVSTNWTLRHEIQNERMTGQQIDLYDFSGVHMTSNPDSANLYDGSESMWDIMNRMDQEDSEEKVEKAGIHEYAPSEEEGIGGDSDGPSESRPQSDPSSSAVKDNLALTSNHIDLMGGRESDVGEFINNGKNFTDRPSLSEFQSWNRGASYSEYERWLKDPQPSNLSVYNRIYSLVDTIFGSELFDERQSEEQSVSNVTYSTASDLYQASMRRQLKLNSDRYDIKVEEGALSDDDWKATSRKPTRERFANQVKALLEFESNWQQFDGYSLPKASGSDIRVGISGISLKKHAINKKQAKRLMWDWEYNLEYCVRLLHRYYTEAKASDDIYYNVAPWDWMIRGYGEGSLNHVDEERNSTLSTGYYLRVTDVFQKRYNRPEMHYRTPDSIHNASVFAAKYNLSREQRALIQGDKDAMVKELEIDGVSEDWARMGNVEVRQIYEEHMSQRWKSGTDRSNRSNSYSPQLHNYGELQTDSDAQMANYQIYLQFSEIQEQDVVNDESPQDLYRDMLTDAAEHDHRGRLLRAFPAFQMFIIDEGRWMSSYRLWDNMYGFNAIQSIDVHRSRKIVADTCIISMTNVYSNLTSRPLDDKYNDWQYSWWNNLLLGHPTDEIIKARKELLTGMMLQPGARIHLRLGYGSNCRHLPIVFNGAITEMDTTEVVTIVAQGDGMELTNVISGDPNDNNKKTFGTIREPRDTLCRLMTSKGNWMADAINYASKGRFQRDHPLGIVHFGTPDRVPEGNVKWFNKEYGEAAQNIYSSNGKNTFSNWTYQDGSRIANDWAFDGFSPNWKGGNEDNVLLGKYNETVWSIADTLRRCAPDYIAAVHPFELRSTLFFGKPYYRLTHKYDSRWEWNQELDSWIQYVESESRKPYMQMHYFDSSMDIIGNNIRASAEGWYTNVIVQSEGIDKPTPMIYADYDINQQYHRTTIVDAPIQGRFWKINEFFQAEKQALLYGYSTVRDFVKDMYQGSLTVLGTPTIKPYDMFYINDEMSDMNGNCLVEAVTHHFSHETGFITNVTPDALVVNDDHAMLAQSSWLHSLGIGLASASVARRTVMAGLRKIFRSNMAKAAMGVVGRGASSAGNATAHFINKKAFESIFKGYQAIGVKEVSLGNLRAGIDLFNEASTSTSRRQGYNVVMRELKGVRTNVDKLIKNGGITNDKKRLARIHSLRAFNNQVARISTGGLANIGTAGTRKAFRVLGATVRMGGFFNPLTIVAGFFITIAAETLFEMFRRTKENMQCVLLMPLKHQGRNFTAGITGHQGMVIGDKPGRIDNFLSGLGFDGEGEGVTAGIMTTWNSLAKAHGKEYSVSMEDLQSGQSAERE